MNKLQLDNVSLETLFQVYPARLEKIFSYYLKNIPSTDLKSAMEYTLLNSGKRLRPLLIYATGHIFDASLENLDIPAASVELIHTYSLIHDDLPCMDDADLRRGKPACHKMYGEGMAILAGDAMHTLAMQIIANHPATLTTNKRIQMMSVLSKACGPFGMATGQALDITVMQDEHISIDLLEDIYKLKTGKLFSACIELGWLASQDDDEINRQALNIFGDCIGLAFQIQDDIFDKEVTTAMSGKPQDIDNKNNKITYPKLQGPAQAKNKVQSLYEEALETINYLGDKAHLLRELAQHMLERKK